MLGPLDIDALLEEILLQLTGESALKLRLIADDKGCCVTYPMVAAIATAAHTAALASRLVCRRWQLCGIRALAATSIRLRLLKCHLSASSIHSFLTNPASSNPGGKLYKRAQRAGLPDAFASELMPTPEAYLKNAYENGLWVAGANADAAMAHLVHLRSNGLSSPFLIFTQPKKLHLWANRMWQAPSISSRLLTLATATDIESFVRDRAEIRRSSNAVVIVSYAVGISRVTAEVLRTMGSQYVILDDARSYMWRPDTLFLFQGVDDRRLSDVGLVLDDFFGRPCTLTELFQLVYFGAASLFLRQDMNGRLLLERGQSLEQSSGAVQLQALIMEAFDIDFDGFSQADIDQLLRPQLEAAIRHVICRPA